MFCRSSLFLFVRPDLPHLLLAVDIISEKKQKILLDCPSAVPVTNKTHNRTNFSN